MSKSAITELRAAIDSLDRKLIRLISLRIELTGKIGRMKKISNRPIFNRRREKEVINNWLDQAAKHGLNIIIANSLARLIIRASKFKQKNNE